MEIIVFILLVAGLCLYLLPTIIASVKHHQATNTVFALNLLAGWTLIGWIAAIIWAGVGPFNPDSRPPTKTTHSASAWKLFGLSIAGMLTIAGLAVAFSYGTRSWPAALAANRPPIDWSKPVYAPTATPVCPGSALIPPTPIDAEQLLNAATSSRPDWDMLGDAHCISLTAATRIRPLLSGDYQGWVAIDYPLDGMKSAIVPVIYLSN